MACSKKIVYVIVVLLNRYTTLLDFFGYGSEVLITLKATYLKARMSLKEKGVGRVARTI